MRSWASSLQVLETARQVASLPVSTTPVPYDEMKSQCEALVVGKQEKMSALLSLRQKPEDNNNPTERNEKLLTLATPYEKPVSVQKPYWPGRLSHSRNSLVCLLENLLFDLKNPDGFRAHAGTSS